MIVNTNIASMNAQKSLLGTNNAMQKSLEKLSSGSRINKAADDAAGLAMSEKMRGQIKGLNQAVRNAQSAISLIQTAEGALNETHSILQRMRELAVQSASDTNTTDDRAKIQAEMDQLAKEVTRISNTTEFNTQNLLAGGLDNTFHIGANAGQNMSLSVGAMDAKSLNVAGNMVTTSFGAGELAQTGITGITTQSEGLDGKFIAAKKTVATYTPGAVFAGAAAVTDNASAYTGSVDKTFTLKVATVAANEVTQLQYSTDGGATFKAATWTAAGQFTLEDGVKIDIEADGALAADQTSTFAVTADKITFTLAGADDGSSPIGDEVNVYRNNTSAIIGDPATDTEATVNFDFATVLAAVGAAYDAADSSEISQTTQSSTAAVTGANGAVSTEAVTYSGIKVTSQAKANLAITTIDNAINAVSEERSNLGAMQNRLEHTINNLQTASENMTSAESRIRDVDMAAEMSQFTKSQILSQAGVAMLAQANQVPQAVLKLLG
ncbi:MAG: hypothetical protein APF84_14855 [Gracilibacter sp. BRH_c7a]|nr:MAG: hypothetical protein APF84_14855 [Gracilibacter sp. BRH_c7a]